MSTIDKIRTALEMLNRRSPNYPEPVVHALRMELARCQEAMANEAQFHSDHPIVLGAIAVREVEDLDVELARLLEEISAEVNDEEQDQQQE